MEEILRLQNEIELLEQRSAALVEIIDGANGVVARSLTEAENTELLGMKTKLDDLGKKLASARAVEDARKKTAEMRARTPGAPKLSEEEKIAKRYSISRTMKHVLTRDGVSGLDGLEREMHDEAMKQADKCDLPITGRGVLIPSVVQRANAATPLAASNLIGSELMPVVEGYKPVTIVDELGATQYKNLIGIKSIPISDMDADAGFVGEATADNVRDLNVRKATLTPRAIRARMLMTWLLKASVGPDLDQIASQRLSSAVANTISRCIIKGGGPNEPTGILDNVAIPELDLTAANGRALTFNDTINLQTLIGSGNAEHFANFGYVTSPGLRGALQRTRIEAGQTDMVWNKDTPNMLNGFKALATTLSPNNLVKGTSSDCHGLIYGAFSQLHVANWNVYEMFLDNSKDDTGTYLKIINFWDWAVTNPNAFAKILAAKLQ